MAISEFESTHCASPLRASSALGKGASSCRISVDTSPRNNVKSATSRTSKTSQLTKDCLKSPYLISDKIQVKSRITGKSVMSKREASFTSSFPLAANIYKTNSDEFKYMKKNTKKVKKSVLTLPNSQIPKQQEYTVSDTNDSGLFSRVYNHELPKQKCLAAPRRKQPVSPRKRGSPVSQRFGVSADSSSIEMIAHFDGDVNRKRKKNAADRERSIYKTKACDVWSMLRNMNRFQFKPSPAISEESIVTTKLKKKVNRKPKLRNNVRVMQSRRDEEIQYISNFEIETLSPTNSFYHASSSSRVTVIDKNYTFEDLCNDFQEKIEQIERNDFENEKGRTKNKNKKIRQNKKTSETTIKVALKKGLQAKKEIQEAVPNFDFNFADKKSFSNATSKITLNSEQDANGKRNNLSTPTRPEASNNDYPKYLNNTSDEVSVKKTNLMVEDDETNTCSTLAESLGNISGITHVVVSKSKDYTPIVQRSPPKTKLRPNTTSRYLNTATHQNQSFHIKRRLARLKFPIIILGKDEVSSTYEVITWDPPQYEGLGEQIWPFMADWYSDKPRRGRYGITGKVNKVLQYCWNKKTSLTSQANGDLKMIKTKKQINEKETFNIETRQTMSKTPMSQLKDKMLKLLNKNSNKANGVVTETTKVTTARQTKDEIDYTVNVNSNDSRKAKDVKRPATLDSIIRQAHTRIEFGDNYLPIKPNRIGSPRINENERSKKAQSAFKRTRNPPWSKARQASDFVDNILSKIKTGVYCNQDNGENAHNIQDMEPFIETNSSRASQNILILETVQKDDEIDLTQISEEIYHEKSDPLKSINGFDETFPGLEVETLNNNRVAIKNCILNVLVHFDIAAPVALKSPIVDKPSSCIPITVNNNKTQIYKCSTTIVNAMLPAELCTILPHMMRNILMSPLPQPQEILALDGFNSHLTVITELFKDESNILDDFQLKHTLQWSTGLRKLINGRFSAVSKLHKKREHSVNRIYVDDILQRWKDIGSVAVVMNTISMFMNLKPQFFKSSPESISACTALIPYHPPDYRISSILKRNSCTKKPQMVNLLYFNKLEEINEPIFMILCKDRKECNGYNFLEAGKENTNKCTTIVKYSKPLRLVITEKIKQANGTKNIVRSSMQKKKMKRNKFVRLIRKCKSSSHITGKQSTTALSKITNLEEFFLALGADKTLCSVFDGISEKRILNCLSEMKNWISEISPRQIMLVLLLLNKKETQNLVKLRPVILQAIAANRITRSSELDMEVEVIERERFCKLSQYDGLSYLPASCENYDSLLEELYWIAKTTASDYQKPFNESSERLLKSLLEKRKKLNPSYLRVLARYVGLGLLKTPK